MKKIYIGIFIAVLTAVVGAALVSTRKDPSIDNSRTNTVNSLPAQSESSSAPKNQNQAAAQPITLTGTIECLTPKNINGPQASSCAIGLKQDDGTSYALTNQDPTIVGSLPTGQRVEVSGAVSQQSSQYEIKGIVNVTSVHKL